MAKKLKILAIYIMDNFIPRFWLMVLRSGGMDPYEAYKVLKNYLRMIKEDSQYFNASYSTSKLEFVFGQQIQKMLDHRDQYGRRVITYRAGQWNPDKIHFNDVFCGGYALCELVAMETK